MNLLDHNQMWSHHLTIHIILHPASHVRRTYSSSKDSKEILPCHPRPLYLKRQKIDEFLVIVSFCLLVLLLFFPIGDDECLIMFSTECEFLFEFLSGLQWLILAQEQTSGFWSQWTLLFCPDVAALSSFLKGLKAQREKNCTRVYVYVGNMCVYIPRGFILMLFKGQFLLEKECNKL